MRRSEPIEDSFTVDPLQLQSRLWWTTDAGQAPASQDDSGSLCGWLAIADGNDAVHEHMPHSACQLAGPLYRTALADGGRVQYRDAAQAPGRMTPRSAKPMRSADSEVICRIPPPG